MTDNEETAKLVETVYKHILENFTPSARQVITAGKIYLKALHGAVAASNGYLEMLSKLANGARESGSTDIGSALIQIAEIQKEIQSLQINVLQAFYVDFLVPLERNLDKDSKLVCCEHKRFSQSYRNLVDTCQKISNSVKKKKKKVKSVSGATLDKDIRQLQALDEERLRLSLFCKDSLKQVIIQERRRYGFVLERQCSLAKHFLHHHRKSGMLLERNLDKWQDVLDTSNKIKTEMTSLFFATQMCGQHQTFQSRRLPALPRATLDVVVSGGASPSRPRAPSTPCRPRTAPGPLPALDGCSDRSPLGRRSVDLQEGPYSTGPTLVRAKSDFNLASSTSSLVSSEYTLRPKSFIDSETKLNRPFSPSQTGEQREAAQEQVRALYSYLSSGEHQLSFLEGDIVVLIGERKKGWQYGENLRTHRHGWFPLTYTTPVERRTQEIESSGTGDYGVGLQVAIPPAPQRPLSTFLGTPSSRDTTDHSSWKSVEPE